MKIVENSRIKTLVEREDFPEGTIGVVVSIYGEGPGCEVELWDKDNYPIDVITYNFNELEKLD